MTVVLFSIEILISSVVCGSAQIYIAFQSILRKKKKLISKLQYSESETRYPHSTLSNFGFVSVSGDRKCTRQAVLNMKPNTPSTAVIVGPEVTGDGDQILGLCTFSFF